MIALNILLVFGFVLSTLSLIAADYKKDYCGNKEFTPGGDDGSQHPHIHCGKDFYTWSDTNKVNMVTNQGFQCKLLLKCKDLIPGPKQMTLASRQLIMASFNLARIGECANEYKDPWVLPVADLLYHDEQ